MTVSDLLSELEHRLGSGSVLRPEDGLSAYEHPARGADGVASAVVRPRHVDDVRVVLAWAREHRVHLLAQGANTGLVGASVPPLRATGPASIVVLSTERMIDGLTISPDDRTAVAPAGLRLSHLNAAAAEHGLWFPIDLAADPSLGGMVATNTGGARMLRYGDVRRRVLGIEAVTADADLTVIDDLSTLRKDNTGPDLSSLFIGSAGVFGVVTGVAVELAPLPAERSCAFVVPTSPAAVVDVLRVVESHLGPLLSAFEVMSRAAVRAAVDHVDGVRSPSQGEVGELTILVEAAGPTGAGEALAEAAAAVLSVGAATEAVAVPPADAWALRHALSEGLARTGVVVGFDVSVSRSDLAGFRDQVRARVADTLPRAVVADFGHWGDGGTHCNLVFPSDDPPDDRERTLAREIVFGTAVADHGGSYSAEHGIGPHNADWWRRVTPDGNREVVRALRDVFDPDRILGHPDLPF